MPSFIYPLPIALVGGLIALPILIHLINMMRHRKVQWAAMEFLLLSQKRNRTWVMLKQFLLLLLRMAAVAAVVLMVSQPLVQNQLGGLLGGSKVHHIVLLDDSYSMDDHWADTSAFAEAKAVIERLGKSAAEQPTRQEMTILRFSRAANPARGTQPDLVNELIDTDQFPRKLSEALQKMRVSQTAVDPSEALKAAAQLIGEGVDSKNAVYVISDFRDKDWNSAAELAKQLQKLDDAGASLQFINCVDTARPNLAITSLKPALGTRAAGVPLKLELTVQNFGTTPVRNVSVGLREQDKERPAIQIEKLDPGAAVTRQFEVRADVSGQRRITAKLPADAVVIDNTRHTVIDFAPGVPVLIIDGALKSGEARGGDGYFLQSALLQPGPVPTGLRPRVEPPRFLDDHALDEFHSIYLCNVDRLPSSAVEKLDAYVRGGGGFAIFAGDSTRADFLNQLYADGNGLFPVPLESPVPLLIDQSQKTPDLQITAHPIFNVFAGESNPFIKMVNVEKYFAVKKGWKPAEGSSANVIARVRNGAPLAVEKKYGDGRVVAFLTTAAPNWNNWAKDNPSYVVVVLDLQSYLSAGRQTDPTRQVGVPLELPVDTAKYQEQVEIRLPEEGTGDKLLLKVEPSEKGPGLAKLLDTDAAGIYEFQLKQKDNTPEEVAVAYNVDASEGNLKTVTHDQLKAELPDVKFDYKQAGDLFFDAEEMAGTNLSSAVLYLLIFLLLGEQLLAYSASYHPARLAGARA